MPEDLDYQEHALTRINEFVEEYIDERGGAINMYELGFFVFAMMWRMRQYFKQEELGPYLTGVMFSMENSLERAREEHPGEIIIAEDWRDMEGGEEMLLELVSVMSGDEMTVPEEWTS